MSVQFVPLSVIANISSGKRPTVISKDLTKECFVPVIGGGGVSGFTDRAIEPKGVLITGRVGTLGKLHVADQPCWPSDNALVLRPILNAVDAGFLRYAVSAVIFEAVGLNRGAANPLVTQKDLGNLEVAVFTLDEQREIATILGALDDKIEVNRKTAATLEAMARALYRSWFVDFDPIWAKLEGRAPAHMDPATAALFPDSFGDDGLPQGWTLGVLGDLARNPRQGADPRTIAADTPYIGLEHIPRRSIAVSDWGVADDVGSTKSLMRTGQFLFGKLRPYFHKVGLVPINGICSTDILVIEAKSDIWREFVLSVISSVDLVEHVNAASTGTRMPRARWQDLADYGIVIATPAVLQAFSEIVKPMHDRILSTIHENKSLAALRDSLLPRLMSGELRVGEAREQIEEVA
ncbi:restriction endonuclease subunit S [Cereibacter azotoformans]|uniref:restriction endonuclease subunit S n=1 Tax=Cereibacter azotoformans TaxID=43057 RepID=UPI000E35D7F1|nr:restriction endonuclease subunit S [Cereibacter azotoformans]AXQ95507.1 restriction endonuclease subunit S [Cereibacter sphaeroides]UIJ32249.1 restriction endonuclease subunit S [Cereibacter azotoformans]